MTKISNAIKGIAAAALIGTAVSCVSIGSALADGFFKSEMGKPAIAAVTKRFLPNCDLEYYVETFDFFDEPIDTEEEVLVYIHGWGNNANNFIERENPNSKLTTAQSVYDNIWLVNYPSNASLEKICERVEDCLEEKVEQYVESNKEHKSPKITLVSNSMGTLVSRYLARNCPFVKKAGIVAGPNEGMDLGIFSAPIKEVYPRYMEELLLKNNKPSSPENYQSLKDMFHESEFLKKLNTPTSLLDVDYYFFGFKREKNNILVSGKDDGIVAVSSAYPYELLKKKKFENVRVKGVYFFEGDVTHFSIENLEIFKYILRTVKSNDSDYFFYSNNPISPRKATIIKIPKCDAHEEYQRDMDKSIDEEELNSVLD